MAEQWTNKVEIKSETSDRVYVVSQHAVKRHWACSCPAWRTKRHCKHLTQLGLPGGERPFEVTKRHAKEHHFALPAKGFLDGYKKYDAEAEGPGDRTEWQAAFAQRLGLDEARQRLGLGADAGWDEVCKSLHLAATESLAKVVGDYERAIAAFDGDDAGVTRVQTARFRLEAYLAYLAEQREKLEAESGRLTALLLEKIELATAAA